MLAEEKFGIGRLASCQIVLLDTPVQSQLQLGGTGETEALELWSGKI